MKPPFAHHLFRTAPFMSSELICETGTKCDPIQKLRLSHYRRWACLPKQMHFLPANGAHGSYHMISDGHGHLITAH